MDELRQFPQAGAPSAEQAAAPETELSAAAAETEPEPEFSAAGPEGPEEAAQTPEPRGADAAAQTQDAPEDAQANAGAQDAQTGQQDGPAEPPDVTVADIHFRCGGKTYFFDPGELTLKAGDHVIIDTARGAEYGFCSAGNHRVRAAEVVAPLRRVLRIATAQDEKTASANREKEKRAFQICLQKIEEHKLEMQLVSAEYAFDGSKLLFFFTADGRVDFRELVKNLASIFRTRIELRQIGVRDKAKMVGGLGVCGRPFCCSQFLDDFQPVSIKMAKTQNLSLNPAKISGTCGRLMCCLKYEQEAYEDLLKTSPKPESFVDTVDGRGTVCDINLLRQTVNVRMEDRPDTIGCYHNCEICVLRNGKAKKNDPPIPRELAPISSKPRQERKPEPASPEEELMPIVFKNMDDYAATPAEKEAAAQPEAAGVEAQKDPQQRKRRRRKGGGQKSADGRAPEQAERPADRRPRPEGGEAAGAPQSRQERGRRRQEGGGPSADAGAPQSRQERASVPSGDEPSAPPEGGKPRSSRRRYRRRSKNPGSQTPPQES